MSTTSDANAIMRYIASKIDISITSFPKKEGANRHSSARITIIARFPIKGNYSFFLELPVMIRPPSQDEGGFFCLLLAEHSAKTNPSMTVATLFFLREFFSPIVSFAGHLRLPFCGNFFHQNGIAAAVISQLIKIRPAKKHLLVLIQGFRLYQIKCSTYRCQNDNTC